MIDLVREIRRRAPADAKPSIKLANPDLLDEMVPWYQQSNDAVVKALIKELFALAGSKWSAKLEQLPAADSQTSAKSSKLDSFVKDGKRYITKVYRGQTQLVEVNDTPAPSASSQRIYRGQLVTA